jgi:hypothetical protein
MHNRQVSLGFTPDQYPEGTHICYLYDDDDERKRFMSAYVSSGLEGLETVTYIADVAPDRLQSAMVELGIARSSPERNHFTAASAIDTYCPDGHFVPAKMLHRLRDMYASQPAGYAGARVTGEMTWALRGIPGSDRLIEYEGRINDLLKAYPTTVLCQYDMRKFDGATIFDLLAVHPIMVVHGQIMRNPFYTWPHPHPEAPSDHGDGR